MYTPGLTLGLLLCFALALAPGHAVAATPVEVDSALKKGIDYLYSKQQNGNWEVPAGPVADSQWGGLTGIATFALLAAEQDPQDPRVSKAVDFLQSAKLRGVYAVAMRAQVWPLMVKYRKVKPFALNDMQLLVNAAKTTGPQRGDPVSLSRQCAGGL